jgi:hypothetical protein
MSRKTKGKAAVTVTEVTEGTDDELLPVSSGDAAERETGIARKVAAAELEAAEAGPDEASAALVTHTLRTQGVRPVSADQPGGTTCPECGQPLIIAPRGGKQYVVCYAAIGEEGACWYHREMPPKEKAK